MNPLMYLLSQQAGVPASEQGEEIVVNATKNPKVSAEDGNVGLRLLGNRPAIEASQDAVERGQEVSNRRGMFGMKGTLRDVVGILGDAFLVQAGRDRVYAPARQQEKISDAWAGATEDPIAAAERVGSIDAGLGQQLLEKAQQAAYQKAQMESLSANRQDMAANRKAGRYDKARPALTALFNQPGAYLPDGTVNPQAKAMAETIANRYGFTLEDFINENMSADEARLFAGTGINPYQQENLEDADVRLEQGQYRNETGRISATRPRAAARPSQPTEAAELSRIRDKVNRGEKLDAGDQATWEKYTRPSGRQRGSGGSRSSGPAKGPTISNW